MIREVKAFLRKARNFLEAGEAALTSNYPERAVSSAYYAMFHSANAMLLTKGVSSASHKETRAQFGRLFARESIQYRKFHRYLIDAGTRREVADYDAEPTVPISKEEASVTLQKAVEFVAMAEEYLKARER